MNRFSELHDDERIVFCTIDHVMEDFRRVATLPHNVVMLIMNGDYSFTPEILKHKPELIITLTMIFIYLTVSVAVHMIIIGITIIIEVMLVIFITITLP